jgi:hypothetical protein
MSVKTVVVETDAAGAFTYERRMAGVVKAVAIDLGTLTTPDVTITDGTWGTSILAVTAVAADTIYRPVVAAQDTAGSAIASTYTEPAILGTLKIVVAGGGANFAGTIRLLFG